MTKNEFLSELQKGLSKLPKQFTDEQLTFYSEMIDDKIEEGATEEEAIRTTGDIDEIVSQIISEYKTSHSDDEKRPVKKESDTWKIVLLIIGCPIWLSLLITVFAVIWAAVVSVWAIEISLAGAGIICIASSAISIIDKKVLSGIGLIGIALIFLGISVALYFGCKWITKSIMFLSKKIICGIKNLFVGKEAA